MLCAACDWLLRVDPDDEFVGNALRCYLFVAEHVGERVLSRVLVGVLGRVHLGEDLGQSPAHRHEIIAAFDAAPRDVEGSLVKLGEFVEHLALLQSTFDSGHHEVLGQPNVPVELGQEDLTDGVRIAE